MSSNEKRIKTRVRNAYLVSTVSIALVLFILGSVTYLIINARKASNTLRDDICVSLLLKDELSADALKDMTAKLKEMPEVKKIEYISKDSAAQDFKAAIGNDFVKFLGDNPLPASLELTLNSDYSTLEYIKTLDEKLSIWDGVDDVIYQETIVEQISHNITKLNIFLVLFGGTLLLISLILINNTIRMAIFSKRMIINTMKLVGATRGFILRPFLLSAFKQGIYAAVIAVTMISVMIYGLNKGIPEAGFITSLGELSKVFFGVVALGIAISMLFTYVAVVKYVRLNANQIHIY